MFCIPYSSASKSSKFFTHCQGYNAKMMSYEISYVHIYVSKTNEIFSVASILKGQICSTKNIKGNFIACKLLPKMVVHLTRNCIITNDTHFPFCLPSGSSINDQDKSNLLSFNCFSEYNLSVRKTSVYLLTVGTVLFLK